MIRTKLPLCKCGCGKPVNNIKSKFLPGHNLRKISEKSELKRKQKLSIYLKNRWENPEYREKIIKASTGRKHSEETKKKLSEMRKGEKNGMYGKHLSDETKLLISKANKGKKRTKETCKKISDAVKGRKISQEQRIQISKTLKEFFKTNPNPWLNKHHTKESKQKMSTALKGKYTGDKASNWQGGKSSFPYAIQWNAQLRNLIKKRDNYKCQNPDCKNPFPVLDVHHIDYNKQNCDPKNLITLCKKCHGKTQKNRKYYIKKYQELMQSYEK